jgi:hypothetical protein
MASVQALFLILLKHLIFGRLNIFSSLRFLLFLPCLLCRYGYAAAILFGVIGYGIATSEKKEKHLEHDVNSE